MVVTAIEGNTQVEIVLNAWELAMKYPTALAAGIVVELGTRPDCRTDITCRMMKDYLNGIDSTMYSKTKLSSKKQHQLKELLNMESRSKGGNT